MLDPVYVFKAHCTRRCISFFMVDNVTFSKKLKALLLKFRAFVEKA